MADTPAVFRGLKGRTLDDQTRAINAGYESMQDYAIDELGQIVVALSARVDALEERAARATNAVERRAYEDSRP